VGPNFTAALTPDGSHLDPVLHPDDLMNTTLSPGVRKLPSDLDARILSLVLGQPLPESGSVFHLVTSGLVALPLHTDPQAWTVRGDASLVGDVLTLREDPLVLTGMSRTLTVPANGRLQFTVNAAGLQANGALQPTDAFEVALLDAHTMQPL